MCQGFPTFPVLPSVYMPSPEISRDAMKLEFEFDSVQTFNIFSRFELWRMFHALYRRMPIHGKIIVLRLILYGLLHALRARECRQTRFFSFSLSHKLLSLNVQHNFCSVMCYTVLIWTLILLTLWNNILLQTLPKPVHYIPTDKINTSIRIQRILKVKIRIRWMWIFTSFATSLVHDLSCSQDFCGCHWPTLTFDPVTFTISSASGGLWTW